MKTLLLFPFLLFSFSALAQAPGIQWQNTIGGNAIDELYSIHETTDGGYIAGGSSGSNISGDKMENSQGSNDYWVVKLDASGNILWQNTIGGSGEDDLRSISQTTDGGYICGGRSASNISGDKTENSLGILYDYWVVKLNASGNIQWQNTIGGSQDDELKCITQTSDGGFICGGWSDSPASFDKSENSQGDIDYWVVKLNANGDVQWENTIGGNFDEEFGSIVQTEDGGYICGGSSTSLISGDKTENPIGWSDYWILKLDALGSIQWQSTMGGTLIDYLYWIQETADDGYICMGYSDSPISGDKTEGSLGGYEGDFWIVKLDALGDPLWQNTIGGLDEDLPRSLTETTDSGYVFAGASSSPISSDKTENCLGWLDYWIIKLDALGNVVWDKTIGGSESDELTSIEQTADGGFICGGFSLSNISGDKTENSSGGRDYWVVKLGEPLDIENISFGNTHCNISPNPFTTTATININQQGNFDFMLYNLFGQQVMKAENISNQYTLERGNLPVGVYFYRIEQEEKQIGSGKVVIE